MSSLEIITIVLEGNGTPTAQGEIRQRLLFRQAVLIAAMVLAGNERMGLWFRMARVQTHLAERREATKPSE